MIRTKKQIGWRILSKTFPISSDGNVDYWKEWEDLIQRNLEAGYEFDGDIQQSTVATGTHHNSIYLTLTQRMAKWEEVVKMEESDIEALYSELTERIYWNRSSISQEEATNLLKDFKNKILGKHEK